MRRIQSLFKTLLMLIPMTAVPVMAIFGIPQFFPVSASPSARISESASNNLPAKDCVGQSDALLVRTVSIERTPQIDLFQPYDEASPPGHSSAGVTANASPSELDRRRRAWNDPLAGSATMKTEVSLRTTSNAGAGRTTAPTAVASVRRHVEEVDKSARRDGASAFSGLAVVPSQVSMPQSAKLGKSAFDSSGTPDTTTEIVSSSDKAGRFSRLASDRSTAHTPLHVGQVETLTWQQAVARLNQLGIRTFRLTPDAGQKAYRFVCLVTSVDDPRISRRFEAESIDPLIAVGDVLAQVENWNQHR